MQSHCHTHCHAISNQAAQFAQDAQKLYLQLNRAVLHTWIGIAALGLTGFSALAYSMLGTSA